MTMPQSEGWDELQHELLKTELETLYHVSQVLSRSLDLKETLSAVLRALHDGVGLERGMVSLTEPETGALLVTVAHGLNDTYIGEIRYRSGEGVVVEWLTNGQVLVVFFTYDLEGKQLGLFGIAPPAVKSVTMEALYPSSSTRWGSEFDPDEVDLDSWGTFTLTWANCDQLTFEYESVLPGFGSAARNYQRLSKLAGTSCPAFPSTQSSHEQQLTILFSIS